MFHLHTSLYIYIHKVYIGFKCCSTYIVDGIRVVSKARCEAVIKLSSTMPGMASCRPACCKHGSPCTQRRLPWGFPLLQKDVENGGKPIGKPVRKWSIGGGFPHRTVSLWDGFYVYLFVFKHTWADSLRWRTYFGICHVKSALKPPTSSVVFGSFQSYFLPPAPSCHLEGLECSNLVSISPHLCHGPALNHSHVRWLTPKKGQYHIVQLVLSISTT